MRVVKTHEKGFYYEGSEFMPMHYYQILWWHGLIFPGNCTVLISFNDSPFEPDTYNLGKKREIFELQW